VLLAASIPLVGVLVVAMWILPLPMTVEWIAEYKGRIRYSPRRQVLMTAIAAPAFGCALALHLQQAFQAAALAPMATYVLLCCGSIILNSQQLAARRDGRDRRSRSCSTRNIGTESGSKGAPYWEQAFLTQESARTAELQKLLK